MGRTARVDAPVAVELEDPMGHVHVLLDQAATARPLCVCGHTTEDHDPVADRYCAATLTNGLTRGCICQPS
jgi:hypothetical protein